MTISEAFSNITPEESLYVSKVKGFQAVLTVSSGNWATLPEAMRDLQKGISAKIKNMKDNEGDVTVVTVSHSSSCSPEGHFASAVLIVDVHDPFAELVLDEVVQ
jgi:hypothetical protein